MSQDILNSLGMLSINADEAKALSFDNLIDKFASQKVRKGLIARRPWELFKPTVLRLSGVYVSNLCRV